MSLRVVWNSPSPPANTGDIPGERSRLLRMRRLRPARNHQPLNLGTRVLYLDEPGQIIAINIAGMGRWPAHLYPFMVLLDCGLLVRCHSMDLDVEMPGGVRSSRLGTGISGSTGWD